MAKKPYVNVSFPAYRKQQAWLREQIQKAKAAGVKVSKAELIRACIDAKADAEKAAA